MAKLTTEHAIEREDDRPVRARPSADAAGRSRLRDYLTTLDDRFPQVAEAQAVRERAEQGARSIIGALAQERARREISQVAVARAMQTSQSAVSRLESGSVDVGLETLLRYAMAIGLDPADVFALNAAAPAAKDMMERP